MSGAKLEAARREAEAARREAEALRRELGEVRAEAAAAREATRAKSAFLARMSHELRTPLNAIIGYGEMLAEDAEEVGDAPRAEDLARVLKAAHHLLALLNDVLDLSKVEAGRMELRLEAIPLNPFAEEIAREMEPLIARNGNLFRLEVDGELGAAWGDAMRVRQCLINLLGNAAKFTRDGVVTLRVVREESSVVFQVEDTGDGIPIEQQPRLFQEFSQAGPPSRGEGTGLGLALSRRLARMMAGDIDFVSTPGRGSTFTLCVPARLRIGDTPGQALSATGRVLVIDDDPEARDRLHRYLAHEGYSVLTAGDGVEGVRLAREAHPAVIVLDLLMPGMDGWQVLDALKSDPALAEIPVVLASIEPAAGRGLELGAAGFLPKPVDRTRLLAMVGHVEPGKPRAVLVVDDDDDARDMLARTLERDGWDVTEAADGEQALARLTEAPPDTILLDLLMPGIDGFELLARLRAEPAWASIPVIVLTSMRLGDADRERLRRGAARVLQKSTLTEAALMQEIRRRVEAQLGGAPSTT